MLVYTNTQYETKNGNLCIKALYIYDITTNENGCYSCSSLFLSLSKQLIQVGYCVSAFHPFNCRRFCTISAAVVCIDHISLSVVL